MLIALWRRNICEIQEKAKIPISDMAAQNVCRYFKFGFCKFTDKCRFMHISQVCENPSCEINHCKLRHPRVCKYFRDYNRCKFSEWCAFKHIENNNLSVESTRVILNKIENLSDIIKEKDIQINTLAEKIKLLEEKILEKEDLLETEPEELDMNCTFANPYLGFPCEMCDFNAKTKSGLQLHMKSKHKENDDISTKKSNSGA